MNDKEQLEDRPDFGDMAGAPSLAEPDVGRSQLRPATFLAHVAKEMQTRLDQPGRHFHTTSRGRLAKFWFGPDTSIHYEIWLHERTGQLELGLHFESAAERNQAFYKAFDGCMMEIQAALGSSFWLEEWDHGWVRLYETHPLWPLDDYRVGEVVERMCEIIDTLQPIYEAIADRLSMPTIPPSRRPLPGR